MTKNQAKQKHLLPYDDTVKLKEINIKIYFKDG